MKQLVRASNKRSKMAYDSIKFTANEINSLNKTPGINFIMTIEALRKYFINVGINKKIR